MEFACKNCPYNRPGVFNDVAYRYVCYKTEPPTLITDPNRVLNTCPLDDHNDRIEISIERMNKGLI